MTLVPFAGILSFAQQGSCKEARDELSASFTPAALHHCKHGGFEGRDGEASLAEFIKVTSRTS